MIKKCFYFFFGFRNFVYETLPGEILGLNFEKKTVYLNFNFLIPMVHHYYTTEKGNETKYHPLFHEISLSTPKNFA